MAKKEKKPAKIGAPRKIKSIDELWGWYGDYIDNILANPLKIVEYVGRGAKEVIIKKYDPPTWQGFEAYLFRRGIVVTLDRYRRNVDNAYGDFIGIIRAIGNDMFSRKFSGAANSVWQHNIIAKELGMADVQHVKTFERPILEGGLELPEDE